MKLVSYEEVKENWKRYLWSTGVTFTSGALAVILAELDKFSLETVQTGVLVGVGLSAIRAGIKAVIELFLGRQK